MPQDDPFACRSRGGIGADRPEPRRRIGQVALGVLRFPGNLVASQLEAKTGESRFELGEDRMIMRTLIDTVVWGAIFVCVAWIWFA